MSILRFLNHTVAPKEVRATRRTAAILLVGCLLLLQGALVPTALHAQMLVGATDFWFAAPDLEEANLCGPGDSPMLFMITNGTVREAHVTITFYNNNSPIVVNQTIAAGSHYVHNIPSAQKGIVENTR